jgi:hypothetical protein
VKRAWVEFLGEQPDPMTDRVDHPGVGPEGDAVVDATGGLTAAADARPLDSIGVGGGCSPLTVRTGVGALRESSVATLPITSFEALRHATQRQPRRSRHQPRSRERLGRTPGARTIATRPSGELSAGASIRLAPCWSSPRIGTRTNATAVTAMKQPRTIHDFYGLSRSCSHRLPSAGHPEVAELVAEMVKPRCGSTAPAGASTTASVLAHIFPDADVPVVQLSINGLQPLEYHLDIGRSASGPTATTPADDRRKRARFHILGPCPGGIERLTGSPTDDADRPTRFFRSSPCCRAERTTRRDARPSARRRPGRSSSGRRPG